MMVNRGRSIHIPHEKMLVFLRIELLEVSGQNVVHTILIAQYAYGTNNFLEASKPHSAPQSVATNMPLSIGINVL